MPKHPLEDYPDYINPDAKRGRWDTGEQDYFTGGALYDEPAGPDFSGEKRPLEDYDGQMIGYEPKIPNNSFFAPDFSGTDWGNGPEEPISPAVLDDFWHWQNDYGNRYNPPPYNPDYYEAPPPYNPDYYAPIVPYVPPPSTQNDSSPYDDYYGPIVPYNPNNSGTPAYTPDNSGAPAVDGTNQDDTPFFSEEWLANTFAGKHKFENGSSNWRFS